MKNKIIFLVCAVFLTVACEKEQHTGKESRVSVTVYDENGKVMPGIPVKMYDEKDYKAFEQDNLTPPTAGATANAQGIALFTLPGEVWFSGQSQRFLTFVVQEGGGPDNYRIWSVGKTIDAGKDIQLEIRLTSALAPGEEQPEDKGTLIGLSIAQPPHKIAYTLGEPLDLDGLLLTGVYSNGKEYPVTVTPEQVSGFSSDAPADRLVLTIGIEDRQATFTVSIAPIRVQEGVLTETYKGYSEITLPPHVTAIAPEAFMQNRQITRVVMNEGLTSIGEMAFFNSGIQEIVFPSTLQQLAPDLFYYCDRLKRVDLSHTQITRIPESAFACSGVEEVLLPSALTAIGTQAFMMTEHLKSAVIPQSVTHIGMEAFRGSGITTVQLPNSISTIEARAFYLCPNLTEVSAYGPASSNHPDAVIKEHCFVGCPNLAHFEIPQSINILGQGLITGNQKVHTLTIPARVTRIDFSAFDNTGIKEVIVEALTPPATSEGEWYGFPETITSISVPAQAVEAYKTAEGWKKFADKIKARPSGVFPSSGDHI